VSGVNAPEIKKPACTLSYIVKKKWKEKNKTTWAHENRTWVERPERKRGVCINALGGGRVVAGKFARVDLRASSGNHKPQYEL